MPSPASKIAFSIGSFDIMWYGILVAVAIGLCVIIPMLRAKSHGFTDERILNYAIVVVLSGIVGARLYYVIFNWDYYGEDLLRIFAFREGGLAIHGGLLFGILGGIIAARLWKDNTLSFLDLAITSVPLGQAIGRWGNYFNQEAHGGPTDLPWGVIIDGQKVHPTFLYESIWCLLLFLFLLFIIEPRRKFDGQTLFLYCMLYSVERFFVESLRTDSLMLGSLRQAQVLSVIVFIGALITYLWCDKNRRFPEGEKSIGMVGFPGIKDKKESGESEEPDKKDKKEQKKIKKELSDEKESDESDKEEPGEIDIEEAIKKDKEKSKNPVIEKPEIKDKVESDKDEPKEPDKEETKNHDKESTGEDK